MVTFLPEIGLLGTITHDYITWEHGASYQGLGGILYQAAGLCALAQKVVLFSNLGSEIKQEVTELTRSWSTLQKHGLSCLPGPGNRVHLYYPVQGERIEKLTALVPPFDPSPLLDAAESLSFLIAVMNSGFDLHLSDWQRVVAAVSSPIWFDVHSLVLSRKLDSPRVYQFFPDWPVWTRGVSYLQTNEQEFACLVGNPALRPTTADYTHIARTAFDCGLKAWFVTCGHRGVVVITPRKIQSIAPEQKTAAADTTGCGDIFGAATVAKLVAGWDPFRAAQFGQQLATQATKARGVAETYQIIRSCCSP